MSGRDSLQAKASLAALSLALTAAAAWSAVHLYARSLGLRDPSFRYENQLGMWAEDPDLAFVNKPDFDDTCFGNVRARTNDAGFRAASPIGPKRDGALRIVGVGDSVMWGTSVNPEDSFLGMLEARLGGSAEVINAGVVGYSTMQEARFLTKHVLPLAPDVVLINYCVNDVLPTEDPFRNVRGLYVQFLQDLLDDPPPSLESAEIERIPAFIGLFDAENVWHALDAQPAEMWSLARKLFVHRPMAELTRTAVAAGARAIWLFIPPMLMDREYLDQVAGLEALVAASGGESLDLSSALAAAEGDVPSPAGRLGKPEPWRFRRDLDAVLLLRQIERVHEANAFIDLVHPSRKGNAIIAEEILRYLEEHPLPPRTPPAEGGGP